MSRAITTCSLSAWTQASSRSTEEQLTAVLASALLSSEPFAHLLLGQLGVDEEGTLSAETEVSTGIARDRIDLELRVEDPDGCLLQRAWIEVKLNILLAGERPAEGSRPARAGQLLRYREALKARDGQCPSAHESKLALLVPKLDEEHERPQVEATGAGVLTWQAVGEMAASRAHQIAGGDWRCSARQPSATLELANLETLVGLLEEGANGKVDPLVDGRVEAPIVDELLDAYARAPKALLAVESLRERLEGLLEDDGWSVEELVTEVDGEDCEDPDTEQSQTQEEADAAATEGLTLSFEATPPGRESPWWLSCGGKLQVEIAPSDVSQEPPGPEPMVALAVYLEDRQGAPPVDPAWLERLRESGFRTEEDRDTARVASVWASAALRELLPDEQLMSRQAEALAVWVKERVDRLALAGPEGSG